MLSATKDVPITHKGPSGRQETSILICSHDRSPNPVEHDTASDHIEKLIHKRLFLAGLCLADHTT